MFPTAPVRGDDPPAAPDPALEPAAGPDGTGSLSAYVKFCVGARQADSAALNCAQFDAWLTPISAPRSSEGTLPIQSTAIVCPAWVMIGPCTVMSTASDTGGDPR